MDLRKEAVAISSDAPYHLPTLKQSVGPQEEKKDTLPQQKQQKNPTKQQSLLPEFKPSGKGKLIYQLACHLTMTLSIVKSTYSKNTYRCTNCTDSKALLRIRSPPEELSFVRRCLVPSPTVPVRSGPLTFLFTQKPL